MSLPAFKFDFDWIDVKSSPDEFAGATMAKLSLRLDDETLISVLNHQNKSYRESVIVPLYPLAEWLVTNWWFLWYEVEELQGIQRPGFESRHNMIHAADGFVYPSVAFLPIGEHVLLRKNELAFEYAPLRFIDGCERIVDRQQVEGQWGQFINIVIERLRDTGRCAALLEEDWAAINDIDDAEREFCQAAALLGLDPYGIDDGLGNTIADVWNASASSLREDLFASAQVDDLQSIKRWVEQSSARVENGKHGFQWPRLRQQLPPNVGMPLPVDRGYELAKQTRRAMGLPQGRVDFEESGGWGIKTIDEETPTRRIEGLVARETPACLIRQKRPTGRRFLQARALGDYLGRVNGSSSLLTSLSNARQRQSRAFAAEFLVPSSELRQRIGDDNDAYVDQTTVEEWADDFSVSSYVIRHQICNHNLARLTAE